MEDKSTNTYENSQIAEMFLKEDDKVVLMTRDCQRYRELKMAEKNDIKATSFNAPLDFILRFGSTLREIVSMLKLWITY